MTDEELAAYRNKIIEECAKVAETLEAERREEGVRERSYNNMNVSNRLFDQADGVMQVGFALRALKSAGKEDGNG